MESCKQRPQRIKGVKIITACVYSNIMHIRIDGYYPIVKLENKSQCPNRNI